MGRSHPQVEREPPKAESLSVSRDGTSGRRLLTISLVQSTGACPFWVGLAPEGSQDPRNLFRLGETDQVLASVARTGVSEAGPIMLSDSSTTPPRFVYLMPPPPEGDGMDRDRWFATLGDALEAWKPERVGLYLAPGIIGMRDLEKALMRAVAEVAKRPATLSLFLWVGQQSFNVVLNHALHLKSMLVGHATDVIVYH